MPLKLNTLGYPANVLNDGSLQVLQVTQLLGLILTELRAQNEMLAMAHDQGTFLDYYRTDPNNIASTTLTNPT